MGGGRDKEGAVLYKRDGNGYIRIAPYKDINKEQQRINKLAEQKRTDLPIKTLKGVKVPDELRIIEEPWPTSFTDEQVNKMNKAGLGNRWTKTIDGKDYDRMYFDGKVLSWTASDAWKTTYLDLKTGKIVGGTKQMRERATEKIKDLLFRKPNPNYSPNSENASKGFDQALDWLDD